MTKPRILFFDIETLPCLVFTWGLGKQYVGYDNMHKERKVSCICYKWSDQDKVHSLTLDMSKHDLTKRDDDADRDMIKKFVDIYNQADLAVGHNAIKFDKAVIRSRLIKHGLPDLAPVIIDDTYLQSVPIGFSSHKLDYISQYLKIGVKAEHPYRLWVDVSRGSRKALSDTVKYCCQDVRLLEKVYTTLLPYIKTKLNRAVFSQDETACPSCGSDKLCLQEKKQTLSLGLRYRLRCKTCGKHFTTGVDLVKNKKLYPREIKL